MQTREDKIARNKKRQHAAGLLVDVGEHAGIKMLLDELDSRVEGIETKLLYNVSMTEQERLCLFVERDCWNWLAHQISEGKRQLKSTTEALKKYE